MFTKARGGLAALVLGLGVLTLSACGSGDDDGSTGTAAATGGASTTESAGADTGFQPINEGQLTVGMNLQFKPQMYLENGEPAGYDVELLKLLAPDLGEELNIQNLDFNGLIPGLQSNKFDMVSVGLSATPERKEVVDFTRGYVPYAQTIGVAAGKAGDVTSADQLNQSGTTITALQGSTAEQLAKKQFPEATVNGFPDQNAAFLEVATGRADAVVVEDYLLAQYDASNPGELEQADIPEPLDVQYGSWAVPKGNEAFVEYLDGWLCEKQEDGTLATTYEQVFGVDEMPPMPPC